MLKLSFVGDISLGEHYFCFGHGPRSLVENGENIFSSVSGLLEESDLVIGNLEGPISNIGYNSKNPHQRVFRGSPKSASQLKKARINVLNIANNHSIQHGELSLLESIELLEAENLLVIGKAKSPIECVIHKNQKIALIGCSLIPDNTNINQQLYFSPNEELLLETVKLAKSKNDHVILFIHWGEEGSLNPSYQQKILAEKLVLAGANILVGHHTHSLQPIILDKESIIAFSLGNFVFDLPWNKKNREGAILHVEIDEKNIIKSYFNLLMINSRGKPIDIDKKVLLKKGENILTTTKKDLIPETAQKLLFFIANIAKGDSMTKMRFLLWKIKKKLK